MQRINIAVLLALAAGLLGHAWCGDGSALAAEKRDQNRGTRVSIAANALDYAGNTAIGYSASGTKFRVYYGKDGSVVYDDANGNRKTGKWSVTSDGMLCYDWWNWTERCYAHYRAGGALHSYLDDKTAASTFIIRRGNVGLDASLPKSLAEIAARKKQVRQSGRLAGTAPARDGKPGGGQPLLQERRTREADGTGAASNDLAVPVLVGAGLAAAALLVFFGLWRRSRRSRLPDPSSPADPGPVSGDGPVSPEDAAAGDAPAGGGSPVSLAEIRLRISQALRRLRKQDYSGARAQLLDALDLARDTVMADHPIHAKILGYLGDVAVAQKDYRNAKPFLEKTLYLLEAAGGGDNPRLVGTLARLAKSCRRLGQPDDAAVLYDRALTLCEKDPARHDLAGAEILNAIGELHRAQGRVDDAAGAHARALAIREKMLKPDDSRLAQSLNNLALAHREANRLDEAERLLLRALQIDEKNLKPDHAYIAQTLHNLGTVYWSQGRTDDAETLIGRVRSIWEKCLGPDHPDIAANLEFHARLHSAQGRLGEAAKLETRAGKMRASHPEWEAS